MQQDQEIPDLLRNLVRDDRERGDEPKLGALEESGRDKNTVDEVVHGVADHDERAGASVVAVTMLMRIVHLAVLGVAMAPEEQLLQHEKGEDADEDREARLAR